MAVSTLTQPNINLVYQTQRLLQSPGHLLTCNDQGNNLEMPLITYLPEDWAQLLSTQKSSICKRCAVADGEQHVTHRGQGDRRGGSGSDHKHQRENQCNHDPKSSEYFALAKSIATLSKNVNVMATHISGRLDKDDNAKPATDGKMASNSHNPSPCKTPKKKKE